MTFIFAILGPNHRVKLGDGAAQLHNFRPRSPSSCRARPGGVGQASRASIIAESAQRRQYVFPLTRFAAWYRVSADFANLSKFSSCS